MGICRLVYFSSGPGPKAHVADDPVTEHNLGGTIAFYVVSGVPFDAAASTTASNNAPR